MSEEREHQEHARGQRQDPEPPRNDAPPASAAIGNAAMQQVLPSLPAGTGPAVLDESVARAIDSKRGSGSTLDDGARRDLEPALGDDFSEVRVHTDAEADALSLAVHADAFTTGNDIFFRAGKYEPGGSEGRKLLAHELTHVTQQRGAPQTGDLTVSDPSDASEREAGAVADAVAEVPPRAPSGRGAPPAGLAGAEVQRQEAPPLEEEDLEAPRDDLSGAPDLLEDEER